MTIAIQTITLKGERYVVMPERQYRRLLDEAQPAALPRPDAKGRRPARQTIEAMIAQDVFEARTRARLTQGQLADAAGIRMETLSRIENARQVPDTRTLRKLSKALGVDL